MYSISFMYFMYMYIVHVHCTYIAHYNTYIAYRTTQSSLNTLSAAGVEESGSWKVAAKGAI